GEEGRRDLWDTLAIQNVEFGIRNSCKSAGTTPVWNGENAFRILNSEFRITRISKDGRPERHHQHAGGSAVVLHARGHVARRAGIETLEACRDFSGLRAAR